MAMTNSLSFPNMFDVSRNRVAVIEDSASVVNRSRLLLLTEPTELYNSPDFGAGLKRYLFHYNTENMRAIIEDRIIAQLDKYEPCVDAPKTRFSPRVSPDTDLESPQVYNELGMVVGLMTTFGDDANLEIGLLSQNV